MQERMQTFYDFQSGQINFAVQTVIPAVNNILGYLNQYAVLYHGNVNKEACQWRFRHVRQSLIQYIEDLPVITSQSWSQVGFTNATCYQTVAFIMYMCRLANGTKWNFPVLLNYGNWVNGGSRTLATGMVKPDPWNNIAGLELVEIGYLNSMLSNPIEVQSDEMLNHILGLTFSKNKDTASKLSLLTELRNNKVYLKSIEDGFERFNNVNQYNVWDQFASWRQQYPTKPKIKIYTNWPKQIHNQFDAWDVVEVVSGQHIIDEINGFGGRSGRLERFATEEHKNPKETVDHVLYVIDPRFIELGDFLVWMDMEHSTYIESTWKFLLYRKADVYKNTYIDISYIMQNSK